MGGARCDHRIERQRHESFAGREDLLERLDQLLIHDAADRWVVVTGGAGMGKSALLARWLTLRERAGEKVPYHFIRRGAYDWDDAGKLVGSLVAQIEERFPGSCEPELDARLPPAARLAAALARVSASVLVPGGKRLVVLIDGLEEYDPPAGAAGDPLAEVLPAALPRGVSLLCSSRWQAPHAAWLEARGDALVRIDLDAPELAASNDATVRAFWQATARSLGLGSVYVDEAVARARGNLLHATLLRKYLTGMAAAQRRVKSVPVGLEAMLEMLWGRVAADPLVVRGLGLLCVVREALTIEALGAIAGWPEDAERRAFLTGARELVVETWRLDAKREYRLHHESVRELVARTLGEAALGEHRATLACRSAPGR
jgi:hypothetical protein